MDLIVHRNPDAEARGRRDNRIRADGVHQLEANVPRFSGYLQT